MPAEKQQKEDDTFGYRGKSLSFLEENGLAVGDTVTVSTVNSYTYTGTIMPRYEFGDDVHIVLKIPSGYNVGLGLKEIKSMKKVQKSDESSSRKQGAKQEKKQESAQDKDPDLSDILLISTGGTIASKIDYRTGGVIPALTASELYDAVPEISEIANVDAEVLFSEHSENLQPEHWHEMAERIASYSNSNYKGIIIAHGTDTMQYSASALSFSLRGFPIPIAMVGSQRSSDRPSSDAASNLVGAARFLAGCPSDLRGVYVVMHNGSGDDRIACHLGTRVRKNHTSKRNAFETIGGDPAFVVTKDGVLEQNKYAQVPTKDTWGITTDEDTTSSQAEQFHPMIGFDTGVALIKYHPGMDPGIVEYFVDNGCKAIILEGTGLGHVGKTMYSSIQKAIQKGVFVGMTSQCIGGSVRMTVYEIGRDLLGMGVVPLADTIPETAVVKAMWGLHHYYDPENPDKFKKIMQTGISFEISS